MGKKTWLPGKSLGKFLASNFGIPPREQAGLVEQISDAVSDTAPLVREAMVAHPGFREIGKHLLNVWSDGVQNLRDKRAYALDGWTPGAAFQGFSDPPPLKARRPIIGRA
jgi:serine/threonine-protein kinase HipA